MNREGIVHRRLDLELSNNLLDYLATSGYDVKMGARQLQRTIRDQLVIPLAKRLNEMPTDEHLAIQIDNKKDEIQIKLETDPLHVELWLEEYEKVSLADHISSLRRSFQFSKQSNIYIQFLSDLDILDRRKKKNPDSFWKDVSKARRYSTLSKSRDRIEVLEAHIADLEDQIRPGLSGFTAFLTSDQ